MTIVAPLDPLRDTRHKEAKAARELVDWLAWLHLGGAAPTTRDAYERTCADLLNAFPDTEFTAFTDGDLMQLLMRYPEKSRRVRKAHLASWFKWGVKTRRLQLNPIDLLPAIKASAQPVIDVFSHAEEAALCSLPSPDGHLMRILFDGGLRKAEATNLTARRLNFDTGELIVREGAKGSKDRVVPMTDKLRHAAANLLLLEGIDRDDFLWYDRPGGRLAPTVRRNRPIAATSFHRWWVRCIDAAGVEYRKPHTTRHTFATRWRERGLDLDDLQQLMGHASVSTTSDLYVHTESTRIGQRMRELLAGAKV